LKVVIRVETEKPESVVVYVREILRQIAKNRHFLVSNYNIELKGDE